MSANRSGTAALVLALIVMATESHDSAGQGGPGGEVQLALEMETGQVDPTQKLGFLVIRIGCPPTFMASYRLSPPPSIEGWRVAVSQQAFSRTYAVKRASISSPSLICHYGDYNGVELTGPSAVTAYGTPPQGYTCSAEGSRFVCTSPKP